MKIYDEQDQLILDVAVDDNSHRHRAIMSEHSLTLYYSLPQHIEIPVGAYCEYENERYTLLRPENLKMKHKRLYEYTVTFSSEQDKAKIWKFRNPVDGRLKFNLTAKPKEHLQMVVDNLNRRESGWTVGECIDGAEKLISYDHDYCWDALVRQASEFKVEFEIVGKCVSLRKVEYNKNNPLSLSYGKGKGFKSGVGRSNTDKMPVSLLFVQGGDTNIDRSKYPENETLRASSNGCLLLPVGKTLSYDGEHFEGEAGYNAANARTYVVDNLGLSIRNAEITAATIAEDSLDRSEDYPKRVSTVTKVTIVNAEKNLYDIEDNTIPEALNFEDYLIGEETMSIIFQSGELAGREFDVKYNHKAKDENGAKKAARRFEIVPQEIDGIMMPGGSFVPKEQDTFAIYHVMLPEAYICDNTTKTGASWDMFRAAVKYLFDNEQMKFSFTGELDGIWAKKDWVNIGGRIRLGSFIRFTNEQFEKDGVLVRIVDIKDYVNNPHSPKIELSNETISGSVAATLKQLESNEVVVEENHKTALQYTKRRYRDAKETIEMLENALLDRFTNSIAPISVETMSLLVGDERLQYQFVSAPGSTTAIAHNIIWSDKNKTLFAPAGTIQHLTIGIDTIRPSHQPNEYHYWNVQEFTSAKLIDGKIKYYLYICAQKNYSGSTGRAEFRLDTAAHRIEEGDNYWLLVGVLNSEYDGVRSFVTLYGFTEILPGRITADKLLSSDGESYFDMLNAAMKLKDKLMFNVNGDGELLLKGTMVQSQSGDKSPIGCYRGVYNDLYSYYEGDMTIYAINDKYSLYRRFGKDVTTGIPPTNTSYWEIQANSGSNGDWTSYVFKESETKPAAPTGDASIPTGWSDAPTSTGRWWMSKAIINGGTGKAGAWSDPVQVTAEDGVDGAYTDFKYRKSTSDKTPPSINKSARNPQNWEDTPPTLDEGEYLWMSQAQIDASDSLMGEWSTPVRISGEKGEPGVMGDWTSYVFKESETKPAAPTGDASIPTGWSDAPTSTGRWWMSKAIINGGTGKAGAWSDPVQVTAEDGVDGAYTDFKYRKSTSDKTPPSINKDMRDPWFWYDTPPTLEEGEFLWMSQAEIDANNNLVGQWSDPVRISGEKGTPGVIGDYFEYRYATNGSTTVHPYMTEEMKSQRNPEGWEPTVPSVGDLQYLWMTVAKIKGADETLLTNWSTPVRITPSDGNDGKEGASPALVFRGVYSSRRVYFGTRYRVDAVKHENTYYVARIDAPNGSAGFSGHAPTDTNYWNPFGSSFESIATGLLLAENANIANLIFRNQRLESSANTNGIPNFFLDGLKNIASFAAGNVVFDKDAAKIGWLRVVKNDLIGYDGDGVRRLRMTPDLLPAANYKETQFAIVKDSGGGSDITTEIQQEQSFDASKAVYYLGNRDDNSSADQDLSLSCWVDLEIPMDVATLYLNDVEFRCIAKTLSGQDINPTCTSSATVKYKDGNAIGAIDFSSSGSHQISIPKAGQVRITFSMTCNYAAADWRGTAYISAQGFPITSESNETVIARNGMMSIFNGNYLRMHSTEGFSVKIGNWYFRITSSGIAKSSNGSQWTNL